MATTNRGIRPVDIAFINCGLHDQTMFLVGNAGINYYNNILRKFWINFKDEVTVPTVWTSMNPECLEKLSSSASQEKSEKQFKIVEIVNAYVNDRLFREKTPYFVYGAVLRAPHRCEHSADGLHMKIYSNIVAAILLLNYICDSQGKWRGDANIFS